MENNGTRREGSVLRNARASHETTQGVEETIQEGFEKVQLLERKVGRSKTTTGCFQEQSIRQESFPLYQACARDTGNPHFAVHSLGGCFVSTHKERQLEQFLDCGFFPWTILNAEPL